MSYTNYAIREMDLAGIKGSEVDNMLRTDVLNTLKGIENQGHSGLSIHFLHDIVSKVMLFKPLTPLLGTPDEWMNISSHYNGDFVEFCFQNNRYSSVFWDKTGIYDINVYVIEDEEGVRYQNGFCRYYIEQFPYYPKEKIVIKENSMLYWYLNNRTQFLPKVD